MDVLQFLLSSINSVPAEVWSVVIETVMAAVIVSPVMVGLKKWWKVHSEKIMLTLVMVGSIASAVFLYVSGMPEFQPWIIAVQGGLVFATTQPVYIFLVKPLFRRIGEWFNSEIEKAAALRAELNEARSAAVPETGLPTESTGRTVDF